MVSVDINGLTFWQAKRSPFQESIKKQPKSGNEQENRDNIEFGMYQGLPILKLLSKDEKKDANYHTDNSNHLSKTGFPLDLSMDLMK